MANELECGFVKSEFELYLCYYVHLWMNTLRKGMSPRIPCRYESNSFIADFLQGRFCY